MKKLVLGLMRYESLKIFRCRMLVNFDLYVRFLADKKMTMNQFGFLWMIYHRDEKNLVLYQKEVGPFSNKAIKDLIDRGYLVQTNPNSDKLYMGELLATPAFSGQILIDDPRAALDELIDVYIPYFMIHGKKQLTTSVDKDVLAKTYHRKLGGDRIKHRIIVEKTKKVAEMMRRDELNPMKIDKYIIGEGWTAADLEDDDFKDLGRSL